MTVYNSELDENLIPTEVEWDPTTQTVQITARLPRGTYPEMIVVDNTIPEYGAFICEGCELDYFTGPSWEDECYCEDCYFERFPPTEEESSSSYPLELNEVCWIPACGCDGNVHP